MAHVLAPHVSALLAPVAAHAHMQDRGTPPVRFVRQAPDYRVTRLALAPAASAPPVLTNDAACQHCVVWLNALAGYFQAQVIQVRERAQVGAIKGSIGHVEVFRMDGVGISIIERPRPLHNHDTPNSTQHPYTLKCEEPVFQNLIGRTARPGKHSEGTVVLIGRKRTRRKYSELVNPVNSEPCYGSLIDLVFDRNVLWRGRAQTFDGRDVLQFMIGHLSSETLESDLIAYISRKYPGDASVSKDLAAVKLTCLEAVQGYIAGALSMPDLAVDALELCRNTYAYTFLEEEFRESLDMFFESVVVFLKSSQSAELALCSREQRDIRYASKLWEWVTSSAGLDFVAGGCRDRNLLFALFLKFHLDVAKEWELEVFLRLVEGWLCGHDLFLMCRHVHEGATPSSKQLDKVEKSVDNVLRYKLPRFVGSVREAFTLFLPNGYPLEPLGALERMLRFGVGSISEVVFCEAVLDDRWIASKIVHIIGVPEVADASELHRLAMLYTEEIMRLADRLPSYCRECLVSWLSA